MSALHKTLSHLRANAASRKARSIPPAFITRYIVRQALGGVLKQRFKALRRQHETQRGQAAARTKLGLTQRRRENETSADLVGAVVANKRAVLENALTD